MKKIEKTQIENLKAIANSVKEERQSLAGIINAIIDCGEQFNIARMLEVKITATQSRKEQRNALYKSIVDNYPVRQRTDAGVTPARFVRITCGQVIYAKLEPFAKYSFAFVQRSILNHLRGTAPLEYTGIWFAVGKEGAKNVYRSLTNVEIEQALKEITLQEEIQLAAADLKKSYLREQSARINKKATEQVAAAHKRVAEQKAAAKEQQKEQQPEQSPEAPKKGTKDAPKKGTKKAPKKGTKKAPKKGAKKGGKKQVAEQPTEAKEQPKEQQPEQSKEQAPEAAKEA